MGCGGSKLEVLDTGQLPFEATQVEARFSSLKMKLGPAEAEHIAHHLANHGSLTDLDMSRRMSDTPPRNGYVPVERGDHDFFKDEGIGPKGAIYIFDALACNTALLKLNLSGCVVGTKPTEKLGGVLGGGAALAAASPHVLPLPPTINTTLVELQLASCGIMTPGGCALALALKTNRTLKVVNLSSNFLGAQGDKAPAGYDAPVHKLFADVLSSNNVLTSLLLKKNEFNIWCLEPMAVAFFGDSKHDTHTGWYHDELKTESGRILDLSLNGKPTAVGGPM